MKNKKLIPLTLSELAKKIVTGAFHMDTEYNIVLNPDAEMETLEQQSEGYYGFVISTQFESLNLIIGEYVGQSETCFLADPDQDRVITNVTAVLSFILADEEMKDTTVYLIEKI